MSELVNITSSPAAVSAMEWFAIMRNRVMYCLFASSSVVFPLPRSGHMSCTSSCSPSLAMMRHMLLAFVPGCPLLDDSVSFSGGLRTGANPGCGGGCNEFSVRTMETAKAFGQRTWQSSAKSRAKGAIDWMYRTRRTTAPCCM